MVIPVIDFSKLNGPDRAATMAAIDRGCEEWGFFQLINHGISKDLLHRVKKVCSDTFKLEREERFNHSDVVRLLNDLVADKPTSGTTRRLDNVDWEDVFLLTDDNQWPSNLSEFKGTMKEYRRELKKLAEKVMEVMDENLGLHKGFLKETFRGTEAGPFFGTKVSHYPPCPRPELVDGLRAHTDAGGVVLLYQDDHVGGLQILKEGRWVDVQPIADAVVVNTGDQVEVLSNGRYKSVWHRVLATSDGNRRSVATFYNPSLSATISPAEKLVITGGGREDSDEVGAYPTFVFGNYMEVYTEQKFLAKEPRFQCVKAV